MQEIVTVNGLLTIFNYFSIVLFCQVLKIPCKTSVVKNDLIPPRDIG